MGINFWCAEFKATLILFLLGEQGTHGEREHQMQRNAQHKHTSSQHPGCKQCVKLEPMTAWFFTFCFNSAENLPDIRLRLTSSQGGTDTVQNIALISHRLQKHTRHCLLLGHLRIFWKHKRGPVSTCLRTLFVNGFSSEVHTSTFILARNSFTKPNYLAAGEETGRAGARKGWRGSHANLSALCKREERAREQLHKRRVNITHFSTRAKEMCASRRNRVPALKPPACFIRVHLIMRLVLQSQPSSTGKPF